MHRVTPVIPRNAHRRAPAQLVGADAEVLGDTGNVLVRRINDLAAEDPGQRGLRYAGTPMKLRGGDPVAIQQFS